MFEFKVQQWDGEQEIGDEKAVMANSAQEAAERVCGCRLSLVGKPGQMRALVRHPISYPTKHSVPFYALAIPV